MRHQPIPDLSIDALLEDYANGSQSPREVIASLRRRAADEDPGIWISLVPDELTHRLLSALDGRSPESAPLFGIPFAIKDNIDLGGVPTTAACPGFAYTPERNAFVVQRLIDAGAIPIGKTNLDQFATGLVGLRSPYGFPANPFHAEYIPGGSSSGSAVAVATGLATFALGTDTAGSGRIPAGLNNLVGLKPSRGLLSCTGVVPACRSLDCVSIFSLHAGDAARVMEVCRGGDPLDPYSRVTRDAPGRLYPSFRFGVPQSDQLTFFGDRNAEMLFQQAVERLESIGGVRRVIDLSPFLEAALLLYDGPWIAERYLAIEDIIEKRPEILHPVTRQIIEQGGRASAADAFRAEYQLRALKVKADEVWDAVDVIVTPTAATAYTVAAVQADPIGLNSNLGHYTNFMNLLDYAACAVPGGFLESGVPFGVTLFAPAFTDERILHLAARFHAAGNLRMGRGGSPVPHPPAIPERSEHPARVRVVVCGAHMEGLALNHQLTERDGRFEARTHTAPVYRLYALPDRPGMGMPRRPGLVRSAAGGGSIEVEVWSLPMDQFGSLVAGIPEPLGIGKVELSDGRCLPGFLCESWALVEAVEITPLGGWRAFILAE